MDTWNDRVAAYAAEVAEIAETIDLILDETRVHTVGVKSKEVNESTAQLQHALEELEEMIGKRETLLKDPEAPTAGTTLIEKLRSTFNIEDARLAKKCEEVSHQIELTHQRALSLFVCQFHLSDLTTDMVRILSGVTAKPTYQRDGSTQANQGYQGGGGFLDEAA
ncbi:hypothetical protein Pla22_32690 [Rubripirellula amarantea]|uniref:FlgN protein n=1 Tax=Rubripirellula amarantea TaxID=2527999 RepID=A0A5C5WI95_9BACT|nr:hypothetical protein [Rubripirellula amarantea]TWT50526.1 hypothetical protein Pla22_32690 [Rubripirellula amarantea]